MQARNTREMRSKPFDLIRKMRLSETSAEDFLCVLSAGRTSTNHFLKRLHNLAVDLKWLSEPVLEKKSWPKGKSKDKRGITWEEHQKIIFIEGNSERKLFYELLWEIGAAQSDTANLAAENIDWRDRTLRYQRQKTGEWAHLMIGQRLEALLNVLPKAGPLFPTLRKLQVSDRSSEFCRRCKLLKIEGVSLHSYRYAFAERARSCGYETAMGNGCIGPEFESRASSVRQKSKGSVSKPGRVRKEDHAAAPGGSCWKLRIPMKTDIYSNPSPTPFCRSALAKLAPGYPPGSVNTILGRREFLPTNHV